MFVFFLNRRRHRVEKRRGKAIYAFSTFWAVAVAQENLLAKYPRGSWLPFQNERAPRQIDIKPCTTTLKSFFIHKAPPPPPLQPTFYPSPCFRTSFCPPPTRIKVYNHERNPTVFRQPRRRPVFQRLQGTKKVRQTSGKSLQT